MTVLQQAGNHASSLVRRKHHSQLKTLHSCCYITIIIIIVIIVIIIIIIIIIFPLCRVFILIFLRQTVPREYSVAAILLLLFMVLITWVSVLNLLYFYISTFPSKCAVPSIAVFCSSLTWCFLGMLFTYFLNDFQIVPVDPIITGITFFLHSTCALFLL